MHTFIEKQEAFNNQTVQAIADLKDTLSKFASALSIHENGKFPSQPQPNPKNQASSNVDRHMDQVKSIITLRSGKIVEKFILDMYENEEDQSL